MKLDSRVINWDLPSVDTLVSVSSLAVAIAMYFKLAKDWGICVCVIQEDVVICFR